MYCISTVLYYAMPCCTILLVCAAAVRLNMSTLESQGMSKAGLSDITSTYNLEDLHAPMHLHFQVAESG